MVIFWAVVVFTGLIGLWRWLPRFRYLSKVAPGGVGLAAKQLASLVFAAGFDPDRADSLYIAPLLSSLKIPYKVKYDYKRQVVTASSWGLWSAKAEMRDGLGAALSTGKTLPQAALPPVQSQPLPEMTADQVAETFDRDALQQAITRAFTPEYNTMAVVVLHNGWLAAEHYAEGLTASSLLPGWSMAKSLTATFAGLAVKAGKLDLDAPGIVPEWRGRTDGGQSVTMDHLLRMTSGLDVTEDQSGTDPNSRMLFVEPDAVAFAAARGLKAAPGTHWEYMSGSTILACRAIAAAVGGTLEDSQTFFRQAFMQPLGAASFIFETDATGTFIGSSYALATSRDWAKFGQLYLQDGVWQGEQLLPERWREYVTRHTPLSGASSYGAGFWTVARDPNLSGLPQDTFYANGFQGQYVLIVPSLSLVVVRLGASLGPTGIWQLLQELEAAFR